MKKYYFGILAILMLTGCGAHVHQLVKEDSAQLVGGELVHDYCGKDNSLVLKALDRSYEARGFAVKRHTHLAELRKRYGAHGKHWMQIFSGLDTDHVTYSVETIAKSSDGNEASCRLMWGRDDKPAGICTDQAEKTFPVRF